MFLEEEEVEEDGEQAQRAEEESAIRPDERTTRESEGGR